MNTVTVLFLLTVTINGQDVTHREIMGSGVAAVAACLKEERAALMEAVATPNDGPEVRTIRAGCFVDIEPTPEH
jgi:hypothetical protein